MSAAITENPARERRAESRSCDQVQREGGARREQAGTVIIAYKVTDLRIAGYADGPVNAVRCFPQSRMFRKTVYTETYITPAAR